jgi:NitT/TauT family transport system substrate-binding protein
MKSFLPQKLVLILLLFVSACAPAVQTANLIPINIQLGTTHQAVYGGFYAAVQNGDYAHEGLDVSFIEGETGIDQTASMLDGTAQFGVMGASALISQRAAGKPVRAIATIFRRDPVVFFSLASSGIVHLQDFVGKKVLVSPILISRLYAMLSKAEIDRNSIQIVKTGSFTDLYTGKVDVASSLITSGALATQQAGHAINIIFPDNYGVHFYSTVIYATDDYIASHPDVITKFLRATFQGWSEAVEDPQAVGPMVAHYNPKADAEFESASMVASLPYVNTGEDHIGWMKPDVWSHMLKTMQDEDEVKTSLDIQDVYTMDFIQRIYGENQS